MMMQGFGELLLVFWIIFTAYGKSQVVSLPRLLRMPQELLYDIFSEIGLDENGTAYKIHSALI